jgi:anti-anti-sigma factor
LHDLRSPPESPTQSSPATQDFECEVRSNDRAATWVRVRGDLDLSSAPHFEQVLLASLSSALLVIIDLRQLTFISSAGLHVIAAADARARRSNRRLVFVRGPAQIDRVFELVGLADQLEMIDLKPVLVSALTTSPPADAA